MPTYRYLARLRMGRMEQGFIEAANEDEAVAILQGRDLLVTSLKAAALPTTPRAAQRQRPRRGRVRATDLITLSRALATMIDSGLPLLKSLETMAPQVQSRRLQIALEEAIQDIRSGSTLRDAIAKHPKVFSKLWVSLIETGEASGQLTKALEQISIHFEKTSEVQRKIVSAMIYPCILIAVATFAILIFVLKIIPTFGTLFEGFDVQLPWMTQVVLTFSRLTRQYALGGLAAVAGVWFLLWRYARTPIGRWQLDGILLRLPVIGQLVQGACVTAFATGLGTMIKAGVPLLHGLEISIASTANTRVADLIEQMRSGAREGRPLADPLHTSDIFPPMVAQMIAVGEETGKLANMLDEIAKFYEEQVTTLVQRLTGLLEPALLITMGLVIGFLIIAMYLPIFQLSQSIRG